jgi:CheY-like chemotaxis protein
MHALIIEDHALIATQIKDGLSDLGYTSFDIADREAMATTAANGRLPDLITADYLLREGTGLKAVEVICATRPIPVVFIVGTLGENLIFPTSVVIQKPFTPGKLAEAVRHAITLAQNALNVSGPTLKSSPTL